MVEDQDAIYGLFVVGVVRVIRGDLKHKVAAGRNLDPLETHLQDFHIVSQILRCETAVHHCGQLEVYGFHCGAGVLGCHIIFPPFL